MRQAIEEGFILDVLANYTTYETYWKVGKAVADDPEYDIRKARRAIARFVVAPPAQPRPEGRDHRRALPRAHPPQDRRQGQGDGRHLLPPARRPLQAGDRRATSPRRATPTRKALVAFSGTVDDAGLDFTESGMNGFPESQTARAFAGPDYGVLIVAEKFQTGYDQPLLHTMFVDKTLVGLAAVQTLSRLNRIHPEKTDTFVLDFRNEAEDDHRGVRALVRDDGRRSRPTRTSSTTWPTGCSRSRSSTMAEARAVAALIADRTQEGRRPRRRSTRCWPRPSSGSRRSRADEQDEVRDALDQYVRAYSFLSQVVDFGDVGARGALPREPGAAARSCRRTAAVGSTSGRRWS